MVYFTTLTPHRRRAAQSDRHGQHRQHPSPRPWLYPPRLDRTANGDITVYRTTLDRLRIGPLTLRNVRASINPNMRADDEILLGMSALKHLELITRDGVLTLRQPATRP